MVEQRLQLRSEPVCLGGERLILARAAASMCVLPYLTSFSPTADFFGLGLQGAGVGGSNATCLQPRAQGGVTFTARNGSAAGYQPFTNASSLTISVRNNGTSGTSGVGSVTHSALA